MRKFLGFVVLFALGFATGAYVLNTYFPNRGEPTQRVAAPGGDAVASRAELARLLEQRLAANDSAPTSFETMLRTASQRISPAVVNIDTGTRVFDFFGEERSVRLGSGSGVIISSDGYVVTNNHVVRLRREIARDIFVTLRDGRRFRATVLGTDSQNDIALLKIDGKNLPVAQLGDSDKLQVGDWVIAVGNPFGLGTTVTAGIVSALNRSLEGANIPSGLIQTDAAINQGNSGGALADSRGRLVGINTAIYSPVGANVGIGFAIPINRVKEVVKEILEYGFLGEAFLGISYVDISDPQVRRSLEQRFPGVRFPAQGMFVGEVVPRSPADAAGIQPGDVILQIDGRPVRRIEDMQGYLRRKQPGERITLRVWRDGQTLELSAVLMRRP